jgi:hypothetical protein
VGFGADVDGVVLAAVDMSVLDLVTVGFGAVLIVPVVRAVFDLLRVVGVFFGLEGLVLVRVLILASIR